jgi:hypothetical protein
MSLSPLIKALVISAFISVQICEAQSPEGIAAATRFPDANAIFLSKSDRYHLSVKDDKVVATCNVHELLYICNETGISHKTGKVYSHAFLTVSDLKASTNLTKGRKTKKLDVEKFELKSTRSSSSFYDDAKNYEFSYPGVETGATLELSYTENHLEPHLLGSFFCADFIPRMNGELSITVDKNIEIDYKLFNFEKLNPVFTKTEQKNEITYKWVLPESPSLSRLTAAPDFRYFAPHIVFYIKQFKDKKGNVSPYMGTVPNLHSWYRQLLRNVNQSPSEQVKQVTDSLIKGATTDQEKMERIFYFVLDNISYVAFEDGLGGFVPRESAIVCRNKFGDCKDMATLLTEMGKLAGLKVYQAWIGSRDIPYKYEEIATPIVDNHMIAAWKNANNEWVFLDGTGKKADISLYTSMIQGKQALISFGEDSFELVTVPVRDPSVSQTSDTVAIKYAGNVITGKGSGTMVGYDRLDFIYRTDQLNKTEFRDFFKGFFGKGTNKTQFDDIDVNYTDIKKLRFKYSLVMPDYARVHGNELYINMNLENDDMNKVEADREIPYEFKHTTTKNLCTELEIPEGYKVSFVPENTTVSNETASYRSTYTVKGNKIFLSSEFSIKKLMLKKEDFEKYNSVIQQLNKSRKKVITLEKI